MIPIRSVLAALLALVCLPPWIQAQEEDPAQVPAAQEEPEAPGGEPEGDPTDVAGWEELARSVVDRVRAGEVRPWEADELYTRLRPVLLTEQGRLSVALRSAESPLSPIGELAEMGAAPQLELSPTTTLTQLYETFDRLYQVRVQLLDVASTSLRSRATGMGVEGVEELGLELRYMRHQVRFERIATPQDLRSLLENAKIAPLPTIGGLLVVALAVIAFRGWRRWAHEGLSRQRRQLREAWTKSIAVHWASDFLWYLGRVRKPLEWMLLATIVFNAFTLEEIAEPKHVSWLVVRWVLSAWFLVCLVDAFVTRRAWRVSPERAKLRLRSLRLVAAWLVFLGLGLQMAGTYVGAVTLYDWVWTLFEFLALPVILVLLLWWRPLIRRSLVRESQDSAIARRLAKPRTGLGELTNAAGGVLFLASLRLLRLALVVLSKFEGGRRLSAELIRREALRRTEEHFGSETVVPLADDVKQRIVEGTGGLVEDVASEELRSLEDLVERSWAIGIVVAERGGGKTTLLRRLHANHPDDGRLVDCPRGGFEDLRDAMASAIGLGPGASPEAMTEELNRLGVRLIAVDNLHRITRPVMGGQEELDRLGTFTREITAPVTWVTSLDSAAWQYIHRARVGRALRSAMQLPPWTESQLGELIDLRAREAGLEPDFKRLSLPHRLQEDEEETLEERNRVGFRRLLWLAADGNPGVSLGLWADALVRTEHGGVYVQLPPEFSLEELEEVPLDALLVLRFLVQAGVAATDEIAAGLLYRPEQVSGVLLVAMRRGWVQEEEPGRFRLTWRYFRPVTRVLARRNLLTSARRRLLALADEDIKERRAPA
jgi:hypothetical protein